MESMGGAVLSERIGEVLAIVVAAVISGLVTALVTWAKTKSVWLGRLLETAAGVAYQKQEATLVKQLKAARPAPPDALKQGVQQLVKLTYPESHRVKGQAINDVVEAALPVLGPVATAFSPQIGEFIEKVNRRVHAQLPAATKNEFERFDRGMTTCKALVVLMLFTATGVLGCQTLDRFMNALPLGWNNSDNAAMRAVASRCGEAVYGADADPSEVVKALAETGRVGASAFRATGKIGKDLEARLQASATGMVLFAEQRHGALLTQWGGVDKSLGQMIRGVTGVDAVDADQVLGLLYAALEETESGWR